MSRDRIVVIEPNGVRRSLPLPPRGLSIGRGPDNDLVLGYDFTSRNHARVTFEGGNYYVVDLGSANGTYLADVRLSPQAPTVWLPNKTLRIGQVIFQLEQSPIQPREPGTFDATDTRDRLGSRRAFPSSPQARTKAGWDCCSGWFWPGWAS